MPCALQGAEGHRSSPARFAMLAAASAALAKLPDAAAPAAATDSLSSDGQHEWRRPTACLQSHRNGESAAEDRASPAREILDEAGGRSKHAEARWPKLQQRSPMREAA